MKGCARNQVSSSAMRGQLRSLRTQRPLDSTRQARTLPNGYDPINLRQWNEVLPEPAMILAAIDRLHHATSSR
jgi:hypothetical protein